jgi:outer membrane lipoprotein-sorting protein
MTVKVLAFLVAGLLCRPFSGGSAWAADGGLPPVVLSAAEEDALRAIRAAAAGVQTVCCDFTEVKTLALLSKPVVSEGRLFFARPARLRWEVLRPVAAGFATDGAQVTRWHQRTGKPERVQNESLPILQEVCANIMTWITADLDAIRQQYEIRILSTTPVTLDLRPTRAEAKQFISTVTVRFAPTGACVEAVTLQEAGGDTTAITFRNVELNRELDAALFR